MKIDKENKREIDNDFAIGWYAVKKILCKFVIVVLILSAIGTIFGFGYKYFKTNTDRIIFKQSVTYNEGMLDDLAKYKYEYDMAKDEIEQEAIKTLVRNRFANFDKSKIENYELLEFLEDCGV